MLMSWSLLIRNRKTNEIDTNYSIIKFFSTSFNIIETHHIMPLHFTVDSR